MVSFCPIYDSLTWCHYQRIKKFDRPKLCYASIFSTYAYIMVNIMILLYSLCVTSNLLQPYCVAGGSCITPGWCVSWRAGSLLYAALLLSFPPGGTSASVHLSANSNGGDITSHAPHKPLLANHARCCKTITHI